MASESYSTCKVRDIAISMSDAPFGTSLKTQDYRDSGVLVIQGKNVQGRSFDWSDRRYVSREKYLSLPRSHCGLGDLIFPKVGTIGKVGILSPYQGHSEYLLSTNTMSLRPDRTKADPLYVYYYFASPKIRNLINVLNSKSVQPVFNFTTLRDFDIALPPLPKQRAIAQILGTLDDKIELNRRTNETLEAMARAIFKSWFVDFDPVRAKATGIITKLPKSLSGLFPSQFESSELGKIPKGWKLGGFGDFCDVKGGYAYKSKDFVNYGYPLVRIKNIQASKTVDLFDVAYLPESCALETKAFWLCDGNLVMAMTGATIGKYGLIVNRDDVPPALLNQRVARITSKYVPSNKPWFEYSALLVTDVYSQVVNIGGGSAQPNISSGQIESCRLIVPTSDLIVEFTNMIDPFMQKWLQNEKQSKSILALINALLPKLLSGEIRVKDAERVVGSVV